MIGPLEGCLGRIIRKTELMIVLRGLFLFQPTKKKTAEPDLDNLVVFLVTLEL